MKAKSNNGNSSEEIKTSFEQVKESFNCRKVGETSLKHKADQVVVYEVLD